MFFVYRKEKKKRNLQDDVVLEPAIAAHYLNWLRDNDGNWRRERRQYTQRQQLWNEYGREHHLKVPDLKKWYINKHNIYVKSKANVLAYQKRS